MPRKKKETVTDQKPCTSKKTVSKRPAFKFDINAILKRRELDRKLLEQTAKYEEEMKVIDELYQKRLEQFINSESNDKLLPPVSIHFDPVDFSNYNIPFKNNSESDFKKLCVQRLHIMSIERNEIRANIQFNHLLRANWSPGFDNVQNILCKWRADLDTLPSGPPLEYQIKDYKNIKRHNFELVISFISQCILKDNKKYNVEELLTIAKYSVAIYFHLDGQMLNLIQSLFFACIKTALKEDNDHAIIAFAQELYSEHNEDDLLNMVVGLFLPLEGPIMKKMYTYLTYKLFKSFLGKTDNKDTFPSSIKEWFVQDLVDKNYFKNNQKKILSNVVQLLEHVVFVLDLYKEEKKMEDMYNFLHAMVNSSGLSGSMRLVNVLDQWKFQLFRLFVNRNSGCMLENNDITNK